MNSAAIEFPNPASRRWLLWLAVIFAVQVGLIFLLSAKTQRKLPSDKPIPSLHLFPHRMTEGQFTETFLATDPSLFVTANQHGFSGNAWLKTPPRYYESHDLIKRTEPPFWLALNMRQFGSSVNQFIATNLFASANQAEVAPPGIKFGSSFLADNQFQGKTNSRFYVEGDLAKRKLVNPPQLQILPHTDLLTNSVAQIAVDAKGTVISSRLISRSGLENADNRALEIAGDLQFSPTRDFGITWGNVVFDWQTTAPVDTTNAPTTPK